MQADMQPATVAKRAKNNVRNAKALPDFTLGCLMNLSPLQKLFGADQS